MPSWLSLSLIFSLIARLRQVEISLPETKPDTSVEAVYKLTGVKDQYLIDHEKFSECVQNVVSAMMLEIKEEKLAIIIPEVSKDE